LNALRVRKNFVFDKEMIDKTAVILKNQKKSFTDIINLYFQAIIKEPSIIETVEKTATKRTGSFIGMLDGKIGSSSYKEMKKVYNEDIS